MIEVKIIPTVNHPLTFAQLKTRFQPYEGNILPAHFTDDFYMVDFGSKERWDEEQPLETGEGRMYSFHLPGHFSLLWTFFSNAGDGELLLPVDNVEYLQGYAFNRRDNLMTDILPKWKQVGFYCVVSSSAGRAEGDLELKYALCLELLKHFEGCAVIDGITFFSLPYGLLTYEEFAKAKVK